MNIEKYSISKLKKKINNFNLFLSISLSNALAGMLLVYLKSPQIIEDLFPNKFSVETSIGMEFLFGVFGFLTGAFMPFISCFFITFILKILFLIAKIEISFNNIFYVCLFSYLPYTFFQFLQVINLSIFPNFNFVETINFPFKYIFNAPLLSSFSISGMLSTLFIGIILINSKPEKKIQIISILVVIYVSTFFMPI